jgi:hypothetical protein
MNKSFFNCEKGDKDKKIGVSGLVGCVSVFNVVVADRGGGV